MPTITLNVATRKFTQHLHTTGRAEGTQKQYGYLLAQWGRTLDVQGIHWQKAKEEHIEDFLDDYRKTHSKSSTALFQTCLSSFYSWAERKKHISTDPTRRLEAIKRNKRLPRPIPAWQIERLIERLNAPDSVADEQFLDEWNRNRIIILTFLYTGLRLAELSALDWDMVDLTSGKIMVEDGKGGKDRIVPIPQVLREELLVWSQLRYNGPLFLSLRDGKRISKHGISEMFRRFVRDHLEMKCTAHRLRHSFATMIIEQDGDIRKLQILLGHARLDTTALYTEVSDKGTRETAALLNKAWKTKKEK